LKTIACYGRVFEGLQGQDLIDYTLRIATTAPATSSIAGTSMTLSER
jgi:hypothetical protein